MSVIFLAGVHGVGKGFLGTHVANSMGITHLTASQLIREEKGQATWGVDKKISDLDDNQLALLRAVNQWRLTHEIILLDGHFVLRNALGVLTPLATLLFKELHLAGVVLLTEDENVIASRLALRDNRAPDVQVIFDLAEAELIHANLVCTALGIPLIVIRSPSLEQLTTAIKDLITHH
jgi:adenylate kinase